MAKLGCMPFDVPCPLCSGQGEFDVIDEDNVAVRASCYPCRGSGCMPAEKARGYGSGTFSINPENPKAKFGAQKPQLALVPPALAIVAAPAMEDGAGKYGPYNWRDKPVESMTYINGALRHLQAFLDGEDADPESNTGALHIGAVAANMAILADALLGGFLVDNRPPKGPAPNLLRKRKS